MNYILVGLKNSGKTTLGRKLAAAFSMNFLDTDEQLLLNTDYNSIREMYLDLGVSKFREREQILISALDCKNTIVATGGGSIILESNRIKLKKLGIVIYLTIPPAELPSRIITCPPNYNNLDEYTNERIKNYLEIADFMIS